MEREAWVQRFADAMVHLGARVTTAELQRQGRELWETESTTKPELVARSEIENLAPIDREPTAAASGIREEPIEEPQRVRDQVVFRKT